MNFSIIMPLFRFAHKNADLDLGWLAQEMKCKVTSNSFLPSKMFEIAFGKLNLFILFL